MKTIALVATALLVAASPALARNNGNRANSSSTAVSVSQASSQSQSSGNTTSFQDRRQAPGFALAGLAAGGLSCSGSASVGVSGPGFGFGIGSTVEDAECERRQWAILLSNSPNPATRRLAWIIAAGSKYVQSAIQQDGAAASTAGFPASAKARRTGKMINGVEQVYR